MSALQRKLFGQLLLLLVLSVTHKNTLSENTLKINTDLTAGVIGGSAGGTGVDGAVSGDIEPRKQNAVKQQQQIAQKQHNATEQQQQLQLQLQQQQHICTREETYVEQLRVPSMQPVRVRTSNWCLEFPPRCSNYKTEEREVVRIENITKTRTIRFCCDGYEGNISINDTICKPVCRGGCGRGVCQTPDNCNCEAGYTGKHCTQRCDHDHWGLECRNECKCQNGAVCDNKSGLCHCTTGWTGELCESPCPMGTYGVMCRKNCECDSDGCDPQTGACVARRDPATPNAALPPNVTHVMIETLNSTIANITHNLDRIAKKIGHIAPNIDSKEVEDAAQQPQMLLDANSKASVPEVIVIKQHDEAQHTPKIIVHGPRAALLENLHSAGGKTPEVIHVITSWPSTAANGTQTHDKLHLAGFAGITAAGGGANDQSERQPPAEENSSKSSKGDTEHEANLLALLLIILLIIMIAIASSFLYVYRRYHYQKQRVEAVLAAHSSVGSIATPMATAVNNGGSSNNEVGLNECGSLSKSYLKPLPDLPAFTQAVRNKIEEPEFYDSPSNNSSVKTPSYTYARKESLYSVVTPKSRKGSQESHLYDEIPYPTPLSLQPFPEPMQSHMQHAAAFVPHPPLQHHVSHLVIQPKVQPAGKFLQMPVTLSQQQPQPQPTPRRIAHL